MKVFGVSENWMTIPRTKFYLQKSDPGVHSFSTTHSMFFKGITVCMGSRAEKQSAKIFLCDAIRTPSFSSALLQHLPPFL